MTEQIPWQEILNKLKNPRQPESEALRAWLNEGSGNQSALDDLQVIYSITGNMPEPFVPQKELAWQKIEGRITTGKIKTGLVQTLLRVAASLLLIAAGVGGGLLLSGRQQANSLTEVYSPYGHKTRVELPDG